MRCGAGLGSDGSAVGVWSTALSCRSSLLSVRPGKCCSFVFFLPFVCLVEVSTAFSLAFQLSPCVYALSKTEWLGLMRGG